LALAVSLGHSVNALGLDVAIYAMVSVP
jgi:hypothetical protein